MVGFFTILVIIIAMVSALAEALIYAIRYRKVSPDRAMVVYGRQMRPGVKLGYMVTSGGGKFILPVVEETKEMDLGLKEVALEVDNLRTDPRRGAGLVRMELTVLYRIGRESSTLLVAAEHLLDKTGEDVKSMTETVLRGHVRGIAATMTAEEIDRDRRTFEEQLQMARGDLLNIGIEVMVARIIRVHRKGVS